MIKHHKISRDGYDLGREHIRALFFEVKYVCVTLKRMFIECQSLLIHGSSQGHFPALEVM